MHDILQFFTYHHLPDHLHAIVHPFCELAHKMNVELPNNPEKEMLMRKLLEAKDCAVRATLFREENYN